MQRESFGTAFKWWYKSQPVALRTVITLNVVIFIIQMLGGSGLNQFFIENFALYPQWSTFLLQPWRMVTYMFLHAGVFHILFNMLWLWWMGRAVEETLGPRTFSVLYFGAGIGGAVLDVFFAQLLGVNYVIGASGAVFGVMVAFAVMFPRTPIMLFLLPPIEARYVVAGLIVLEVLFVGAADNTARIVHIGGAGVGYLLIKAHYSGFDLSSVVRWFEHFWLQMKAPKKSKGNMRSVSDVEIIEEEDQTELDKILEKISKKGYDGLTDEEKRKLFELSKRN